MRKMTYREAVVEALTYALENDPKTFIAGEDVGLRGGAFKDTYGLQAIFGPDRIIDTPISEMAIAGIGVGAAVAGYHPIVEITYIDFIGVCMDEIMNQAAKIYYMYGGQRSVPMVLRCACGTGAYNAAHHSQSLEALVCHIPGLKVIMAATPADAKGLLLSAIYDKNPVICIEHRMLYNMTGDVPEGNYTVPLGKADVAREGKDVTLVTWSMARHTCLEAAERLAAEGIDCEVVDLRTLIPYDKEAILNSVKKTNRLCIVHEANKTGGFGSEISAFVAENCIDYLDAPIVRVAGPDTSVPYSFPLEDEFRVDTDNVVTAVKSMF